MALPIKPNDVVDMHHPDHSAYLTCAPAYARADNFLFRQRIYKLDARIYLHHILASIVIHAARAYHRNTGGSFLLYDGLRTVDAQSAMLKTQRVLNNPHWLEKPALLSSPGSGAHPRAMAIDLTLLDAQGTALDMGTVFDYLAEKPDPVHNPAHRDHPALSQEVQDNRQSLTRYMMEAANTLRQPLLPLPQEWWDYRLPSDMYERYAPLYDRDLPEAMQNL